MENVEINSKKENQVSEAGSSAEIAIGSVGNNVFNALYEKSGMISLIRLRDRMNECYESENYAAIYQIFAETYEKIFDKSADTNDSNIFTQLKNIIRNGFCTRTVAEDIFTNVQDYIENVDASANIKYVPF